MIGRRDRFVAVGKSVRQALIENEGLPPGRIEVVYNGIDLRPENVQRAAVRAEFSINETDFLAVQVARLDPIKDHQTAIRAVISAAKRNPNIRLLIVGDGPEKTNIQRQLREQSINGTVKMLGLRNDVPRLLAAADVFLLTSVSEGIPVTVIEAMAAGVPVLATSVGGLSELVTHGVTGYLAPPGNANKLADALVELAEDSTRRVELAERAKNRANSEFSEGKMIDNYTRLYAEMLP
jgi:glycosyltransferase involved in cell wall biosynthesis